MRSKHDYRTVIEVATNFIDTEVKNGEAAQLIVSYNGKDRPQVILQSKTKEIELTAWLPYELQKHDPVTLRPGYSSWREYITSPKGLGQLLEDIAIAQSKGLVYKEGSSK